MFWFDGLVRSLAPLRCVRREQRAVVSDVAIFDVAHVFDDDLTVHVHATGGRGIAMTVDRGLTVESDAQERWMLKDHVSRK